MRTNHTAKAAVLLPPFSIAGIFTNVMSASKRKILTLKEKLRVVEMRDKGYSYDRIASEFGIGKSTVFDIVKQKDRLTSYIAERDTEDGGSRKKMRAADDDNLDRAVHLWFTQERSKGNLISGPVIMEKARILHALIYPDMRVCSFKASHGWLHRFKQRHGIREIREKLAQFIEDHELTLNQVFNCDETGCSGVSCPIKPLLAGIRRQPKVLRNLKIGLLF